ncbi:MFS antiporter QDR2 [Candida viswanathii]|uniref:MFS antiporter QDR2 n=1 Tax=Candida viswanathii TaxID=5486 RepID=A0A367YNF8_9ASCO|nr:MFS antiporter QDR2 [Candida viswanathii]
MTDKEPPKELEDTTESKQEPPYSIFDSKDRLVLIVVLSSIGVWSAIANPIYYPALPTLTQQFHTTPSVINLSVVAYLIFQGIAPIFSSNLADTFGRRPVLLASVLIFCASCIGLSQTNVYWLLAVLRCVQAASIAPLISIGSGVCRDVCTSATLGGMVGAVGGLQLAGNGIGKLLGAALISGFHTWRSIFVFLAIGGGVTFVIGVLFLPETSRRIVGNGSVAAKNVLHKSAFTYLPRFKKRMTNDTSTLTAPAKFDVLGPFRIFFQVNVLCTLLPVGMHFAAWTVTLTSLSTELESDKYNYSVMHVGLIYLPQGIACFLGSVFVGKTLNWYYRYRKSLYDEQVEEMPIDDRPPFNIVSTRLTLTVIPAVMTIMGLLIFGWCIQYRSHIISIIISTMMVAFAASVFISICTTLLVDLYPDNASASSSCLNLMRGLLGALFAGVLDTMIGSLGLGGTYTLIAGLCLICDLFLAYVLYSANRKFKNYQQSPKDELTE